MPAYADLLVAGKWVSYRKPCRQQRRACCRWKHPRARRPPPLSSPPRPESRKSSSCLHVHGSKLALESSRWATSQMQSAYRETLRLLRQHAPRTPAAPRLSCRRSQRPYFHHQRQRQVRQSIVMRKPPRAVGCSAGLSWFLRVARGRLCLRPHSSLTALPRLPARMQRCWTAARQGVDIAIVAPLQDL